MLLEDEHEVDRRVMQCELKSVQTETEGLNLHFVDLQAVMGQIVTATSRLCKGYFS